MDPIEFLRFIFDSLVGDMSGNPLIHNIKQQSVPNLTALILAGGFGTRLRTVVHDRPKVMANVAGRPFLAYILDQIVGAGIKRAVVCTGYLADSISTTLGDEYKGVQLVYSQEPTQLGTAGALRLALSLIQAFPVLVFNGDSYVNIDLHRFVQFHRSRQSHMTLALAKKPCSGSFGLVEVESDGVVKRFSEKIVTGKAEWVNAGIYVMEKSIFGSIPQNGVVSLEREIFPKWVGQGLHGYAQEEELFDIGTPLSFTQAQLYFSEQFSGSLTYS